MKSKARKYELNPRSRDNILFVESNKRAHRNIHSPPSYTIQIECGAINPFFKQLNILLVIEIVRFLSVASLVLFLQIALVSLLQTLAAGRGDGVMGFAPIKAMSNMIFNSTTSPAHLMQSSL